MTFANFNLNSGAAFTIAGIAKVAPNAAVLVKRCRREITIIFGPPFHFAFNYELHIFALGKKLEKSFCNEIRRFLHHPVSAVRYQTAPHILRHSRHGVVRYHSATESLVTSKRRTRHFKFSVLSHDLRVVDRIGRKRAVVTKQRAKCPQLAVGPVIFRPIVSRDRVLSISIVVEQPIYDQVLTACAKRLGQVGCTEEGVMPTTSSLGHLRSVARHGDVENGQSTYRFRMMCGERECRWAAPIMTDEKEALDTELSVEQFPDVCRNRPLVEPRHWPRRVSQSTQIGSNN